MPQARRIVTPQSGVTPQADGLNFTDHMRALCADLCGRLDELSHVETSRVAIRFCQARVRAQHGLYASLTPLRFAGGLLTTRRRGRMWTIERLYDDAGREMLYLLSFYLPRFLERTFDDKLATVLHELWHIGPAFDGDLRRHPGRYYAHGRSRKCFDAQAETLAVKWLALEPPPSILEFLRFDPRELVRRHGRIVGQRIRTPKLIPAPQC
jgi:hypothetical protein